LSGQITRASVSGQLAQQETLMLIGDGWVRAVSGDIEALKSPLRIVEKWTDDAALGAHLQSARVAAFSAAIAGLARQGSAGDAQFETIPRAFRSNADQPIARQTDEAA
jgi:hypothetical protein